MCSETVEEQMLALRSQGWSYQRIGDRFGITRQRAMMYLHRLGVEASMDDPEVREIIDERRTDGENCPRTSQAQATDDHKIRRETEADIGTEEG